jgi:hypothetical protein
VATEKALWGSSSNLVGLLSGICLSPEETFSVIETVLGYRYAKLGAEAQKTVEVLNNFPLRWRKELCLLSLQDLISSFHWYSIYFFGILKPNIFQVTSVNVKKNWSNNYTATFVHPIYIPWSIDETISPTTVVSSSSNGSKIDSLESNVEGSFYLGSVPYIQASDSKNFYYKVTDPLHVTLRLNDGRCFFGSTSLSLDKIEISTEF